MAPSLGLEFYIPGPATLDGIVPGPWDEATSQASCTHIVSMLEHLKKHPSQGGPAVMEMEKFWKKVRRLARISCRARFSTRVVWML